MSASALLVIPAQAETQGRTGKSPADFNAPSPYVARGIRRNKGLLLAEEQNFSTAFDRLRACIEASLPGDEIMGERGAVVSQTSENSEISFRSMTVFQANGCRFAPLVPCRAAVMTEENAHDIELHGLTIDCGGSVDRVAQNTQAGIFISGGQNIYVGNPSVKNFSVYAIQARASRDQGLSEIHFVNAKINTPALNSSFALFAHSPATFPRSQNVYVSGGDFWGTDPSNPVHGDYTPANQFTGDYITFHGIRGGHIRDCQIRYSGSSGITVSRGSENIHLDNVFMSTCYEPAVNVGSGFGVVHVADASGFHLGEGISSPQGVTGGTITHVLPDRTGTGAWIWIAPLYGSRIEPGDTLIQAGFTSKVTKAPAGTFEAGQAVIPSARNIVLRNLTAEDVCIQGGGASGYAFIQTDGGETSIRGCSLDSPRNLGKPAHFVSRAHSDVGIGSNNSWRNRPVGDNDIGRSGARGSWQYANLESSAYIFSAFVGPDGNAKDNGFVRTNRISTGKYHVEFKDALDANRYQVVLESLSPEASASMSRSYRNKFGFDVHVRLSETGTPTDSGFFLTVISN